MRVDYRQAFPPAMAAMRGLEEAVREGGLEDSLLELVRTRASQINGCAYCLDMHTKDARARGEAESRLHLLAAWREAECFTPRERAALAWCEAVTLVASSRVPDALFAEVAREFDARQLVALTLAVIAINGWNRLAVAFRPPVGGYVSPYAPPAGTA
jgi:AhpD family alkylhydroperoxidase